MPPPANQQLYSLVYCAVGGALLVEHTQATLRRLTDAQVIKTVARGFSGVSPGAPWCSIDVDEAVPSVGFDLDPTPYLLSLQSVEIQLQAASLQSVSKGFILEDTLVHAVDSPSKISFRFIGAFPVWK